VRERVKVDGVWYAGSHGMELIAPDGTHHEILAAGGVTDTLAHAARRLAETLYDVPGIAVEHKGFALAVHYRNADSKDVNRVIAAARELARSEGLRITPGRKVIELRPSIDGDKGTILNWLLQHIVGGDGADPGAVLPVYIGDEIRRRCLRRG
jgi:alpha,alpha-trehalase